MARSNVLTPFYYASLLESAPACSTCFSGVYAYESDKKTSRKQVSLKKITYSYHPSYILKHQKVTCTFVWAGFLSSWNACVAAQVDAFASCCACADPYFLAIDLFDTMLEFLRYVFAGVLQCVKSATWSGTAGPPIYNIFESTRFFLECIA